MALALVVLAAMHLWHALLAPFRDPIEVAEGAERWEEVDVVDRDGAADVVEHVRNWYDYIRGFDAHHGPAAGDHPEHGSFWRGLLVWADTDYLRGYTLGDDVYVCPNCPRIVRVHQAGHAPSFGTEFEPLRTERRNDGGLEDEPLRTLDVMLPGGFPDAFLRFRDPRGLSETYESWVASGRIRRSPG
jgi:hypothetical protein